MGWIHVDSRLSEFIATNATLCDEVHGKFRDLYIKRSKWRKEKVNAPQPMCSVDDGSELRDRVVGARLKMK